MKLLTKFTFLFFIIAIAFSSCTEESYADWKILNDNRYSAELDSLSIKSYTKTESGLCYKIIHKGEILQRPNLNSYIKVRYTGRLITNKVFDSGTYEGYLSGTVAGWREALTLINVGGSMVFFLPADLGYGSTASGKVPPYSMMYFTVELLDTQNY
jgi:FKBP-type peptidyl-prolyl cis-trans isomerase